MRNIGFAVGWTGRLRALPALARDFAASLVVLAAFAAAAALPLVTVPAAGLVLLPVLLLTAVAFGRDSALLAALLAATLISSRDSREMAEAARRGDVAPAAGMA